MRAPHFALAVLALAIGGFAIGTTEFVTMGLLPEVADGVGVSIPIAGHMISAYALGVVVGAPVLAFLGARLPRRALLLGLMVAFAVGNGRARWRRRTAADAARFAAGLPHGAYFGVASLVAASMARTGPHGRAVAMVMLGLSVANVWGSLPRPGWASTSAGARRSGRSPRSACHAARSRASSRRWPGDPDATVAASCVPSRWHRCG